MPKYREITPAALRCIIGACPSVFETDTGSLVVIGSRLGAHQLSCLPKGKIAEHEFAVEVPRDLLARLAVGKRPIPRETVKSNRGNRR
jgi:hypothetical protein